MGDVRGLRAIRWAAAEAQRERQDFAAYVGRYATQEHRPPFPAVVTMWCQLRNRPQSDRYGDLRRTKDITPQIRALDYAWLSEEDWFDVWSVVMYAEHDRALQEWFVQQIHQFHPQKEACELAAALTESMGKARNGPETHFYQNR